MISISCLFHGADVKPVARIVYTRMAQKQTMIMITSSPLRHYSRIASRKVIFRLSCRRILNTKSKRTPITKHSDNPLTQIHWIYLRSFEEIAEIGLRKSVMLSVTMRRSVDTNGRLKIARHRTAIKFAEERRYGRRSEKA